MSYYELYKRGLAPLADRGVIKPAGNRLLLRAILPGEGGELVMAGQDHKSAICHEVVAAGPQVEPGVEVGDHVFHIAEAGDAISDDLDCRYVLVEDKDIIARWNPRELE